MKHQLEYHLTKVVEGDVEFLYVDKHWSFRNPDHLLITWDTQSQSQKIKARLRRFVHWGGSRGRCMSSVKLCRMPMDWAEASDSSCIPGQPASAALLGSLLESESFAKTWPPLSSSSLYSLHLFWSPFFLYSSHLRLAPLCFSQLCSAVQPAGQPLQPCK